ncbi:MAG TPA: ATP-binding cassette domain-containing protein [Propionibacteriaceae bacterium]|nr:ATP-binding cassette domain-containing protein [Propionibacteriaceae bacterium]
MRLQISGLRKSFGRQLVLDDVGYDTDVSALAIIGPSGGGKSTLLRLIAGLIPADAGTIHLGEVSVPVDETSLRAYRRRNGFVFQANGLFTHLTGIENLVLPLVHVHGRSDAEAHDRASGLLARFSLSAEADKYPHQMSGGQQQRMAIARALATDPDWLFLDEPTSALDPEYTAEVLDMLAEVRADGMRTIIVTHHIGFARTACDHLAFLTSGSLVETGLSSEVLDAPQSPELQRFLAKVLEWG